MRLIQEVNYMFTCFACSNRSLQVTFLNIYQGTYSFPYVKKQIYHLSLWWRINWYVVANYYMVVKFVVIYDVVIIFVVVLTQPLQSNRKKTKVYPCSMGYLLSFTDMFKNETCIVYPINDFDFNVVLRLPVYISNIPMEYFSIVSLLWLN